MQGLIVDASEIEQAQARLADLPSYESQDFAGNIGTAAAYEWDASPTQGVTSGRSHIVVLDEGLKLQHPAGVAAA